MGGDFVFRFIREERRVGIFTPGGEAAIAGKKRPVIRAADQTHKKGRHLGDVSDAVVNFTTQLDKCASRRLVPFLNWALLNKNIGLAAIHNYKPLVNMLD